MRCPSCGFDNPPEMKFCGQCGTTLSPRCSRCGFENPAGFAFCGQCGTPLTGQPLVSALPAGASHPQTPQGYTPPYLAEKILTSRNALEGERKQVTVLFADLKGSMELLADRDPEDARQLLDPVLERMMAAVHHYEGTVNQVMGDGIMALFGAPIAHEDHAVRACYAALAMQEAVRRYREEVRRSHGIEVQIRVGLHSGEVVVRSIGNDLHMDYSAIGQTTHLAARMEQLATPGSIRLSAATLRLVEGLVRVNPLGPVPVKGLAEAVEVFELVGASAVRQRLQAAAARGLTRFVGRETEMTALAQALTQAGGGHGQLVAAVGEAGVGKSRLLHEFVHSPHTQGWLALEAASVSYGKAAPYFPVVDLLKRYMHVEDGDEPRTVRAKVTGHLLTLDDALQEAIAAVNGPWRWRRRSGMPPYRRWRTYASSPPTTSRPTIVGRLTAANRPWPSLKGRGAMSALGCPTCPPCWPGSTSPYAMPSWARSPRGGPLEKKGCGLPRRWRTLGASCLPRTHSGCWPSSRATCPGRPLSLNRA